MRRTAAAAGRPGRVTEAHSHHGATSDGNKCVACHMPQIATTIADVKVRSHTFNSHFAVDDGQVRYPKSLHVLPREDHQVGARRPQSVVQRLAVADDFAVEGATEKRVTIVPDGASIHPLIVHFPIACASRQPRLMPGWGPPLQPAASPAGHDSSYVIRLRDDRRGARRREVSQHARLPGMAQEVVKEHWDWAFRTVWFFAIMIVVRLARGCCGAIPARRRSRCWSSRGSSAWC